MPGQIREDKASGKTGRQGMEFHENKAKQPFIGFVQIWQVIKRWHLRAQTRRLLQQMSDERLRDVGLRRDQVE